MFHLIYMLIKALMKAIDSDKFDVPASRNSPTAKTSAAVPKQTPKGKGSTASESYSIKRTWKEILDDMRKVIDGLMENARHSDMMHRMKVREEMMVHLNKLEHELFDHISTTSVSQVNLRHHISYLTQHARMMQPEEAEIQKSLKAIEHLLS